MVLTRRAAALSAVPLSPRAKVLQRASPPLVPLATPSVSPKPTTISPLKRDRRPDRILRSRGKEMPSIFPHRKKRKVAPKPKLENLECVPWSELSTTQKASIERIRRDAFPGKQGDRSVTCKSWSMGNVDYLTNQDARDSTMFLTSRNHEVVAAVHNGQAIGYAAWLDYIDSKGHQSTFLGYLAVSQMHRYQGVGRFLMDQFSRRGKRLNLVGVLNSVDGAMGFYRKMGWKFTPEVPQGWPGVRHGAP